MTNLYFSMFREAIWEVKSLTWRCIGMWCQRQARCSQINWWCLDIVCHKNIDEKISPLIVISELNLTIGFSISSLINNITNTEHFMNGIGRGGILCIPFFHEFVRVLNELRYDTVWFLFFPTSQLHSLCDGKWP